MRRYTYLQQVAPEAIYQKVTLHPSMTDYCDTCKNLMEELSQALVTGCNSQVMLLRES